MISWTVPTKILKGTIVDFHLIALGKGHILDLLRIAPVNMAENVIYFFLAQRLRLARRSNKVSHAGNISHQMPGILGHFHFNQDIAGQEALLSHGFLSPPHLDNLFSGHYYLSYRSIGRARLNDRFEIGFYFVFVTRISMQCVPLLYHRSRPNYNCGLSGELQAEERPQNERYNQIK